MLPDLVLGIFFTKTIPMIKIIYSIKKLYVFIRKYTS
jgi:hypothetical protein